MASVLTEAYFTDEAAAFAALEGIMWPNGPVCPHCGGTDRIGKLEGVKDKKGRVRLGLHKCYDCRGQFTVRKGTVFEASHLKLHQWFQAAYLLCSSKKGCSSTAFARPCVKAISPFRSVAAAARLKAMKPTWGVRRAIRSGGRSITRWASSPSLIATASRRAAKSLRM